MLSENFTLGAMRDRRRRRKPLAFLKNTLSGTVLAGPRANLRERQVLGTNRQISTVLDVVERQIPRLEAAILFEGRRPELATNLADLWARRRLLRQFLRVREVEASKKVVDFAKWRDGNGARQLIEARTRAA